MKIGVLLCDHTREHLQPRFGDYPERFHELFANIDPAISVRIFDVTANDFPQDSDQIDVFIISGSKTSCYEDIDWVRRLGAFVRTCHNNQTPLIGICFGHQMVAQALGGVVAKSRKGWGVGVHTYMFNQPLTGFEKRGFFSVLVSHQDQVLVAGDGAKVLAWSDFCPLAMLSYGTSTITVQGHPELTKDYMRAILDIRRADIGEEAYNQALFDYTKQAEDTQLVVSMMQYVGLPISTK